MSAELTWNPSKTMFTAFPRLVAMNEQLSPVRAKGLPQSRWGSQRSGKVPYLTRGIVKRGARGREPDPSSFEPIDRRPAHSIRHWRRTETVFSPLCEPNALIQTPTDATTARFPALSPTSFPTRCQRRSNRGHHAASYEDMPTGSIRLQPLRSHQKHEDMPAALGYESSDVGLLDVESCRPFVRPRAQEDAV